MLQSSSSKEERKNANRQFLSATRLILVDGQRRGTRPQESYRHEELHLLLLANLCRPQKIPACTLRQQSINTAVDLFPCRHFLKKASYFRNHPCQQLLLVARKTGHKLFQFFANFVVLFFFICFFLLKVAIMLDSCENQGCQSHSRALLSHPLTDLLLVLGDAFCVIFSAAVLH